MIHGGSRRFTFDVLGGYAVLFTVATLLLVTGLLGGRVLQLVLSGWLVLSLLVLLIRRATMPELKSDAPLASLGFDGWARQVIAVTGFAALGAGLGLLARSQ